MWPLRGRSPLLCGGPHPRARRPCGAGKGGLRRHHRCPARGAPAQFPHLHAAGRTTSPRAPPLCPPPHKPLPFPLACTPYPLSLTPCTPTPGGAPQHTRPCMPQVPHRIHLQALWHCCGRAHDRCAGWGWDPGGGAAPACASLLCIVQCVRAPLALCSLLLWKPRTQWACASTDGQASRTWIGGRGGAFGGSAIGERLPQSWRATEHPHTHAVTWERGLGALGS